MIEPTGDMALALRAYAQRRRANLTGDFMHCRCRAWVSRDPEAS